MATPAPETRRLPLAPTAYTFFFYAGAPHLNPGNSRPGLTPTSTSGA